jgi:glutamine---fructose-6-phosphate transaminase (isomerizing)
MGASYNAVLAATDTYRRAGLEASPWLGSDLSRVGAMSGATAAIGISQSGRSPEVISSFTALPGRPKLAVTDDDASPLSAAADATISLSLLDDSAVRTLGYTGTLQALGLVRDELSPDHAPPDWTALPDEVERLVSEAELFAERVLPTVAAFESFDVVGSGSGYGTAAQGALLLREVSRLPGAAYDTYQYLHGPLEAAAPGRCLILIGDGRETTLAASLAEAGVTVVLITTQRVREANGMVVFAVPAQCDDLLPILEVVPLQTLAVELAVARGLPVGEFRHHQDDTKVV